MVVATDMVSWGSATCHDPWHSNALLAVNLGAGRFFVDFHPGKAVAESVKKYQKISKLKPTQFAVGILEIHEKVAELEALSKSELRKKIKDTPIPVVISPHKDLYLVDHHHFAFACWHLDVEELRIKVVRDLSHRNLTHTQFWKLMKRLDYFYPYCQFGEGPRNPIYLPRDISGLADDPYRSLAWFVKKEGGYRDAKINFSEFRWANFFRAKKLLHLEGRRGFAKAVGKALILAKSQEAKRLPGYLASK